MSDEPQVDPEDVPTPEPEQHVPPGLGKFVDFLRSHPRLKAPSIVTCVLWIVLLVGAGLLHISDANTSRKIDKASRDGLAALQRIHNAEACTFRVVLGGLKSRAERAAKDKTTSESAQLRAKNSLPQYKFLLDGQVTEPPNVNCKVLLRQLAHTPVIGRVK